MLSARSTATLALLLCACGPGKGGSTDAASSSTAATTGDADPTTTTPTTSTTAAATAATDTGGTSESTGMNGLCIDGPPDAGKICTDLTDRAACNNERVAPELGGCLWIPWFPVRLVEGTCTFGDPRGSCAFIRCSEEGCADLRPCNSEGFGGGFIIDPEGKVSVGFADWCLSPPAPAQACIFDGEGMVLEGPPECACLCDPAFPGA